MLTRHKIKTSEYDLTNKNGKTENFIFFIFYFQTL